MAEISKLIVRFSSEGAGRLKTEMRAIRSSANKLTKAVAGMSVAVAGAGAAGFGVLLNNAGDVAKEMDNLSRVAGVSVEAFQGMKYAAATLGIEQGKFADIMKDVQDKVGDFIQNGGGEMKDFFTNIAPKVGVTADQFKDLSGPDAMQLYVSSLEKANLSQSDMTFYMEAIANDATLLLPLMKDNGKAMKEYSEQLEKTGLALNDLDIQNLKDMDATFLLLKENVSAMGNIFAAELSPYVTAFANQFLTVGENSDDVRERIAEFAKDFVSVMTTGVGYILDWVRGLEVVGLSLKAIGVTGVGALDLIGNGIEWLKAVLNVAFADMKLTVGEFFAYLSDEFEATVNDLIKEANDLVEDIPFLSDKFGAIEPIDIPAPDLTELKRGIDNADAYLGMIETNLEEGVKAIGLAWEEVRELALESMPSEELKRKANEVFQNIDAGAEKARKKAEQVAEEASKKAEERKKAEEAARKKAEEDKARDAARRREQQFTDRLESLKRSLDREYAINQRYLEDKATLEQQYVKSGNEAEYKAYLKLLDDKKKADLEAIDEKLEAEKKAAEEAAEATAEMMKAAYQSVFDELDKHMSGLGSTLTAGFDVFQKGLNGSNAMALGAGAGQLLGNIGGGEYGGLGSSIGALAGAAFFGPLGGAIGGALGGLAGGFFGGEESDKTQSVNVDLSSGKVTQGGFGGDKFSQENRSAADSAGQAIIDLMKAIETETGKTMQGVVDLAVGSRDGIDLVLNDEVILNNAEDLKSAIDLVFENMLSQAGIASDVYKSLAAEGEGFTDTFLRVEAQFNAVNQAADLVGFNFGVVGDQGLIAADALVKAAGGMDSFVAGTNFFYEHFFSEQEKFADNLELLTSTFADLGYELPGTREEFKNLVTGLDTAAEAGQNAYAALIGLGPAADTYFTQLEGWEAQLTKLYGDLLQREPDVAGLEYWITQLESGQMTIEQVAESIGNSTEALLLSAAPLEESAKGAGEAIAAVSDEMLKLLVDANQFASNIERDAALAGLNDKDKDVFLLNEWRQKALNELQSFTDQGVEILGGPETL